MNTLRLDEREYAAVKARVGKRATTQAAGGEQLHLPIARRRKATMTAAELRAQQPESEIRGAILEACLGYPSVAWLVRCEAYSGYVLPQGQLNKLLAALHAKGATWKADAVYCLLRRHLAWREFGSAGLADLIGQLRSGPMLAIECKRPGERADAHQQAFLDNVTRAGGCACVAHDAREAIERIDAFVAARQEKA